MSAFATKSNSRNRDALKGDKTQHTFGFEGTEVSNTPENAFKFLKSLKSLRYNSNHGYFANQSKWLIPKWRNAYTLCFSCGIHRLYGMGLDFDATMRLNQQVSQYLEKHYRIHDTADKTSGDNFMTFVYALRNAEGQDTPVWFVPCLKNSDVEVSMSVSGGGDTDYFSRGRSKFYSSHKKVSMGQSIQSHASYRLCGR